MTDRAPSPQLRLRAILTGINGLGRWKFFSESIQTLEFRPWLSQAIEPVQLTMPAHPGLATLTLILEDSIGTILHRNFTAFRVSAGPAERAETIGNLRLLRFAPNRFTNAQWSLKQWSVLDGLKVNGAGHGHFEYRVPWPDDLDVTRVAAATLLFEASAKHLFGKDKAGAARQDGDFMLGQGTHDPSLNPNAYPMTDTTPFPSAVRVRVSGESAGTFDLPDDPADHRGILSWHAQLRDKKLREAGSYGYLLTAIIPHAALQAAAQAKEFVIRFEVDPALPGGLAIYGERFGRYPLDPTVVLTLQ